MNLDANALLNMAECVSPMKLEKDNNNNSSSGTNKFCKFIDTQNKSSGEDQERIFNAQFYYNSTQNQSKSTAEIDPLDEFIVTTGKDKDSIFLQEKFGLQNDFLRSECVKLGQDLKKYKEAALEKDNAIRVLESKLKDESSNRQFYEQEWIALHKKLNDVVDSYEHQLSLKSNQAQNLQQQQQANIEKNINAISEQNSGCQTETCDKLTTAALAEQQHRKLKFQNEQLQFKIKEMEAVAQSGTMQMENLHEKLINSQINSDKTELLNKQLQKVIKKLQDENKSLKNKINQQETGQTALQEKFNLMNQQITLTKEIEKSFYEQTKKKFKTKKEILVKKNQESERLIQNLQSQIQHLLHQQQQNNNCGYLTQVQIPENNEQNKNNMKYYSFNQTAVGVNSKGLGYLNEKGDDFVKNIQDNMNTLTVEKDSLSKCFTQLLQEQIFDSSKSPKVGHFDQVFRKFFKELESLQLKIKHLQEFFDEREGHFKRLQEVKNKESKVQYEKQIKQLLVEVDTLKQKHSDILTKYEQEIQYLRQQHYQEINHMREEIQNQKGTSNLKAMAFKGSIQLNKVNNHNEDIANMKQESSSHKKQNQQKITRCQIDNNQENVYHRIQNNKFVSNDDKDSQIQRLIDKYQKVNVVEQTNLEQNNNQETIVLGRQCRSYSGYQKEMQGCQTIDKNVGILRQQQNNQPNYNTENQLQQNKDIHKSQGGNYDIDNINNDKNLNQQQIRSQSVYQKVRQTGQQENCFPITSDKQLQNNSISQNSNGELSHCMDKPNNKGSSQKKKQMNYQEPLTNQQDQITQEGIQSRNDQQFYIKKDYNQMDNRRTHYRNNSLQFANQRVKTEESQAGNQRNICGYSFATETNQQQQQQQYFSNNSNCPQYKSFNRLQIDI